LNCRGVIASNPQRVSRGLLRSARSDRWYSSSSWRGTDPLEEGVREAGPTVKVHVRGYLTLKDVVGGQPSLVIEAESLTLRELVARLSSELGDDFGQMVLDPTSEAGFRPEVSVLVNGRHHTHLPDRLDTQLADGDEVAIFPPLAGG
jgi:MoaD family protein